MADMPRTLPVQGLVNVIARGLLRLPVISRRAGRRLITLYVVGRKSGRRYPIPVAYIRHNGKILFGTPFAWARNLQTGKPVDVRYRGRRRTADVEALTDEAAVVAAYDVIARDNRSFAGFNNITFDGDGNPVPADLHRAWAQGARAFYLDIR